jgi:cellulose 1,4-beta-cellobiosidase
MNLRRGAGRTPLLRGLFAAAVALVLSAAAAAVAVTQASAAVGCRVNYTIINSWQGGFGANISITNLGDPLTSWTLEWDFPDAGQRVTQLWNGNFTQAQGSRHVRVTNVSYNGSVGTNASVNPGPGLNGTWSGSNPVPPSFTLNGTVCTGDTTSPSQSPSQTGSATVTPTVTTSIPPDPGGHVPNPYAGATGYINPDYAAQVQASATAAGGTLGQQMARVANFPTAVWLDRIAAVTGGSGVTRTLAGHLDAAVQQDAQNGSAPVVITIVVYDLPNRDCAALASNGELLIAQNGMARYRTEYIDPIANIINQAKYDNLRIAAIVEPDSLPNLVTNLSTPACAEANSTGAYVQGIQYALNKLNRSNVYKYLDMAHSGWLGWSSNLGPAADLISNTIKGATGGVNSVDGFISNTANYTPTSELFMTANQSINGQPVRSATFYEWNDHIEEASFSTAMRNAFLSRGFPSGIGMLIDTSRNGWGGTARPSGASTSTDLNTFVNASKIDRRPHRGGWCNQKGAGIGARPTTNTGIAGMDGFVWIKPPGESDGVASNVPDPNDPNKKFDAMCDGDPNARSRYNSQFPTNAMPGAPHAGRWFEDQFRMLVQNAFPAL